MNQIAKQLQEVFGIENPMCTDLNTPTNDVIEVTAPSGHFALKLYTVSSVAEVQWEIDLTIHLTKHNAPVAKPVLGKNGYLNMFVIDGRERTAVLFEWATGEKPKDGYDAYVLLGKAAALIHQAADTFTSSLPHTKYDTSLLIDEQIERMKKPLIESGQLQSVIDLAERLRQIIANPRLDYGICHMDLKPDNVHQNGDMLTVFDLDSAGESWRAIEPYRILKISEDYFKGWLEGYRLIRIFNEADEKAVAAFGIIGDIRNVVWNLGLARSSRGKPLLRAEDLPGVVDEWLEWERKRINS